MWCDDPPEDPVISIFAGCLANHDRAHSLNKIQGPNVQGGACLGGNDRFGIAEPIAYFLVLRSTPSQVSVRP